jgi:hypothetical protein
LSGFSAVQRIEAPLGCSQFCYRQTRAASNPRLKAEELNAANPLYLFSTCTRAFSTISVHQLYLDTRRDTAFLSLLVAHHGAALADQQAVGVGAPASFTLIKAIVSNPVSRPAVRPRMRRRR